MFVLYTQLHLNGIEKLFDGIVEDTEISSSSDYVFLNYLYLFAELLSTLVEVSQKMVILKMYFLMFFTKINQKLHIVEPLPDQIAISSPLHTVLTLNKRTFAIVSLLSLIHI